MTALAGPIAITGSTCQIGRALQTRLAGLPNEVGPLDRTTRPGPAVGDAELVVHPTGALMPRRWDTYRAATPETVETTAAAVAASDVRRVVLLSLLTADRDRPTQVWR